MTRLLIAILLLSCSKGSSQTVFVTTSNNQLFSLNLQACTSNLIGPCGGFLDIAQTPDGRLWGIVNGDLFQIDTTNGDTSFVCHPGYAGVSLVDLNDSILLIEDNMNLYGIKITDCSSYYIGYIGYQATGDLTWYDKDLYMISNNGRLIKIVLDSSFSHIVSSMPVSNNQIPGCEGVVTVSFTDSVNSLVGFAGTDAYKICPLDGSYYRLCSTIVPNPVPGGAAMRLPVQVPSPFSCYGEPNNLSNITEIENFIINPNPVSRNAELHVQFGNKIFDSITVRLLNDHGNEVLTETKQFSKSIDLSLNKYNLPSGVFVLEMSSERIQHHELIIIE